MERAILLSLLLVAAGVPAANASHADDSFSTEGEVLVGNPASGEFAGASENVWFLTGNQDLDGVDGDVVELPSWAPGHPIWVNGTSAAPYDLDVFFYDEDRTFLDDTDCATSGSDEHCRVPDTAAYAVVDLSVGTQVDFTLELISQKATPA